MQEVVGSNPTGLTVHLGYHCYGVVMGGTQRRTALVSEDGLVHQPHDHIRHLAPVLALASNQYVHNWMMQVQILSGVPPVRIRAPYIR